MTPTPFRFVIDSEGLDSKVRVGIQPLADSLNVSVGNIVDILTGNVGSDNLGDEIRQVQVATLASVSDSFPLVFKTKVLRPQFVAMTVTGYPAAQDLTLPIAMQGFGVTDQGLISIPWITNLMVSSKYSFAFWVRA